MAVRFRDRAQHRNDLDVRTLGLAGVAVGLGGRGGGCSGSVGEHDGDKELEMDKEAEWMLDVAE